MLTIGMQGFLIVVATTLAVVVAASARAQAGATPSPAKAPAAAPAIAPTNAPTNASTNASANAPALAASGAGYHDPRSAFKPLIERDGVLSWQLLASVTSKVERARIVPTFAPTVQSLNGKTVKVQGFMLPLEPGEKQRHFLLSAVPTSCSFCVPAGPEGLIEIRTRAPVRFTVDALTLEGKLAVLSDDQYGLFYRVTDAAVAP